MKDKRRLIGLGVLFLLCVLLPSCGTTSTKAQYTQNTTQTTSIVKDDATSAPIAPIEAPVQLDPSHPSGFKWSDELLVKVDEGIALSATEPVSAFFKFKSVLEQEKDGPNTKQREWLQNQINGLQPKALSQVQVDFDNALKATDLSETLLMAVIGKEIDEGLTTSTVAQLSVVKGDILSGKFKGPFVWEVSKLAAERISGSFTEDGSVFEDKMTLTPNSGFELIRVKAIVTNISTEGTKSYSHLAFGGIRRNITTAKPGVYRWLSDEMLFLVTPGGDFIAPSYPLAGWGTSIKFTGPNFAKIVIPEAKISGESANIDLIFSVPKGVSGLRFLMYGAEPHNLPL